MKRLSMLILLVMISLLTFTQEASHSKFIIVDQFGYLPDMPKVAVLKDPKVGFDADSSFSPGNTYALVNEATGEKVFSAAPVAWNNGATDASSGDRVWWFDFSSFEEVC